MLSRARRRCSLGICARHTQVLPCLTPAAAAAIRHDAERTAERLGGWKPRAVGCCTNDLLVSQLGVASQQLIFDAFRRVIMPFAIKAFPDAKLCEDSLPSSVECFFIIKYKADKSRKEFGEHIDHTKITVNISLTSPTDDYTAGGLFFPCSKGLAGVDTPGRVGGAAGAGARAAECLASVASSRMAASQSKGLLLKAGAGTAVIHHGDVRHAGDRIESGERLQLVAFFYGKERRGNALPRAVVPPQSATAETAPADRAAAPTAATHGAGPPTPSRGATSKRFVQEQLIKAGGAQAVAAPAKAAPVAPSPPSLLKDSLAEPQRLLTLEDIRSLAQHVTA